MPGGYDEMTDRPTPTTSAARRCSAGTAILRHAMESHGFKVYEAEWWHFDFHDWRAYPILNTRFEDLE